MSRNYLLKLELDELLAPDGSKLLRDIPLGLETGDIQFICGPNGSGKTSLLKALLGLYDFTGLYQLSGNDFKDLAPKDITKKISWVPQTFSPPPSYLVKDFLEITLDAPLNSLCPSALGALIPKTLLSKKLESLSGGELRRVLIAEAILESSELIIIDEPEAHLDPKNSRELYRLLIESKKTLLVVSHDFENILDFSNKTLGIKNGQLDFYKEKITKAELASLYDLDFQASGEASE